MRHREEHGGRGQEEKARRRKVIPLIRQTHTHIDQAVGQLGLRTTGEEEEETGRIRVFVHHNEAEDQETGKRKQPETREPNRPSASATAVTQVRARQDPLCQESRVKREEADTQVLGSEFRAVKRTGQAAGLSFLTEWCSRLSAQLPSRPAEGRASVVHTLSSYSLLCLVAD